MTQKTKLDLSPASKKTLRDAIFSWLYVAISEVTENKTDAALIKDLTPYVKLTPALTKDISDWNADVRSKRNLYLGIANLIVGSQTGKTLTPPWDIGHEHPLITELQDIFK